MKALSFGKIDFAIQTLHTANIYIRKNKLTNIVVLKDYNEIAKYGEHLHFGIAKEKPVLHSIINKSINDNNKKEFDIIETIKSCICIVHDSLLNNNIELSFEKKDEKRRIIKN